MLANILSPGKLLGREYWFYFTIFNFCIKQHEVQSIASSRLSRQKLILSY